ncbi:adenylate kinase 4, mitochondrial isoform 2-T3 [Pholidichthys leucotaenia]
MAKLFRAAIMGPPGSGKGTISKRIAQSFGLQYLSSGHFLRQGIAAKTEAGLQVKGYVERGLLVPDHVMTRLMLPKLEQLHNHSWLLDGFPRTLAQARALNNLCQLNLVISLNIPYETLRERLSDRWIHPASGRVYNMGFNPPREQVTRNPALIFRDRDGSYLALYQFSPQDQNGHTAIRCTPDLHTLTALWGEKTAERRGGGCGMAVCARLKRQISASLSS